MLAILREFLSRTSVPGRYVSVHLLAKMYLPGDKQEIDEQIGEYVFRFDFSDELQRQMYFGLYDQAETVLIVSVLALGDVVFDIGANVGYYSMLASQLVGPSGQGHAFEPIRDTAKRLRSAVPCNDIKNIVVNQVAVGTCEGTLDLYVGCQNMGNSRWASVVPSDRRPNVVTVRQRRADEYVAAHGIKTVRLVKLDIEGFEPEAISGMHSLLDRTDAPDILCELNPWLLERRGFDSRAITLPLAAHGYRLFSITRTTREELDASQRIAGLTNIYGCKSEGAWQNGYRLNR